ncbi:response regulator [Desulforhopalus sp. IMCC35007]|nr:response regulator [Desulforhopalus sp. IMCC35007]
MKTANCSQKTLGVLYNLLIVVSLFNTGGVKMSSLALFPCSATLDSGIIGELSKTLSLTVYTDNNLFGETAERFSVNPERLKKIMYSKTSVFNQFTLEKEKSINMFKQILADKLASPVEYLFHGFLTSLIPPPVTEVLRVLVVDQKEGRIERAITQGVNRGEAKKNIRHHDVSAFYWTDFLFKKEAYDSSLYDLVIPVEDKNHRQITKEILSSFHKTSVLRTPESQSAVKDMKMQAEIEHLLLANGHKMDSRVKAGHVTLIIDNSVLGFSRLKNEVTELVEQVSGVTGVSIERCKSYVESVYRQQKFELPSKVLFVDDEREFVQTVSQRLNSRDVGTYGVFDGQQALELIAEDRPDVMVLDLKMPGMYGVEVLRKTKEIAPEVEVIILTGHGTAKDREDCLELGAFAYLNKPVNIEELSATIKAANDKVHAVVHAS